MQKNHLKKIFKLEGYILDKIEYRNSKTFLHCHLQKKSMNYRGEISRKVNETRVRNLPHMLLEDETVILVITQRRFYFPRHKIRRWEPLPDVSKRKLVHNITNLSRHKPLAVLPNMNQPQVKKTARGSVKAP